MWRQIRRLSKFVERCPKPQYDTGCTYCQIPEFPPDKQIDFQRDLAGTAASPWKYVLVQSHGHQSFESMPSKINLIPGSLAADFEMKKRQTNPSFPVGLSNVLIPNADTDTRATGEHRVRVYPDGVEVAFPPEHLDQFIENFLLPEEDHTQTYNPFGQAQKAPKIRKDHSELFQPKTIKNDLVVICGHTQRDVRCGVLAPLLQQEFEKVLTREQLKVDVGLISHIGGHAYAGNVIYFPADANKPVVWYGRVFPEHVQGIVEETIKGGRIIKELYRGH